MITILHGGGVSRDPQKWLRNMCTTPNGDEDNQWYQGVEGEVGEEDDQGHPGDEVDKGWQGQGDEDDRGDMVMRAGEFKMTFRKIIILIKKLLKF